jgi:hypothetical protein
MLDDLIFSPLGRSFKAINNELQFSLVQSCEMVAVTNSLGWFIEQEVLSGGRHSSRVPWTVSETA